MGISHNTACPKNLLANGPATRGIPACRLFLDFPGRCAGTAVGRQVEVSRIYAKLTLEVACSDTVAGKDILGQITEHSKRHSIYRNHVLHIAYEAAKTDEFGDIEKPERFQVLFSLVEPVRDQDIVLSDEHMGVLQRNLIDLHGRREILAANGVPARRGILLHGPPGTGKTFACRFLCHKLKGVTRIFVTGSALLNVGAIFSFARLLQPTVLFLEDVDLIFASREISLYSTALGDLLDQLDGLRSHEKHQCCVDDECDRSGRSRD